MSKSSPLFISECMPIIASSAVLWAIGVICFGLFFTILVSVNLLEGIVIGVVTTGIGAIIAARMGKQAVSFLLFFAAAAISGLEGGFFPLLVPLAIAYAIITIFWLVFGTLLNQSLSTVIVVVIESALAGFSAIWVVLAFVFHENVSDWQWWL